MTPSGTAWHDPSRIDPGEVYEGYRRPPKADNWDKALMSLLLQVIVSIIPNVWRTTTPVLVVTGDDDRMNPPSRAFNYFPPPGPVGWY